MLPTSIPSAAVPAERAEPSATATEGASRTAIASDRYGLAAFVVYLVLSALFFGRGLTGHLSDYHVGVAVPADSTIFIWSLAWWRHALLNHLNPLLTTAIWAPGGINLAWVTTAPLAAVIAIPLTSALGPVVTCNVLFILSPALAASSAFLLCRRIANSYWPAIMGGYIFGFSAYMLGQMRGHLHQVLVFPVPLIAYLAVRHYQRDIRTRTFVILSAFAIAAEFLIALEVFATMIVFGLVAVLLSVNFTTGEARKRVIATVFPLTLGLLLSLVLVSPFIYYLFASGAPRWGTMYSADPIGWLIPTTYFELGRLPILQSIARNFPFDQFECGTYAGPVLIVIVALFGRRHWRDPFARMMIDLLVIIAVLSLGPMLHVMHHNLIGLPGAIVTALPLMSKATPTRFAMYAFLILAIATSLWLNEAGRGSRTKIVVASVIVLSTLPNLSSDYWVTANSTPDFFTKGAYRKYIAPGDTVITLPYWMLGNGMLWQAQTDMYFRLAGGWTGPPPPEYEGWPIVKALATDMLVPDAELQLKAFAANHNVTAVIAGSGTDPVFSPMLATLDDNPLVSGGVTLYRVRPESLAPYRKLTAIEMETRSDGERIDTLIAAANRYLAEGRDLAALNVKVAEQLGLIPSGWARAATAVAFNALWLGQWEDTGVSVGITGSYAALKPVIAKYHDDAERIYFPFPTEFHDAAKVPTGAHVIMLIFDRAGLARAAAKASAASQNASGIVHGAR